MEKLALINEVKNYETQSHTYSIENAKLYRKETLRIIGITHNLLKEAGIKFNKIEIQEASSAFQMQHDNLTLNTELRLLRVYLRGITEKHVIKKHKKIKSSKKITNGVANGFTSNFRGNAVIATKDGITTRFKSITKFSEHTGYNYTRILAIADGVKNNITGYKFEIESYKEKADEDIKIYLFGDYIEIKNTSEIMEHFKITRGDLTTRIRNKVTLFGYVFVGLNSNYKPKYIKYSTKAMPVQITHENGSSEIVSSMLEAARKFNISVYKVDNSCRNGATTGGRRFKALRKSNYGL